MQVNNYVSKRFEDAMELMCERQSKIDKDLQCIRQEVASVAQSLGVIASLLVAKERGSSLPDDPDFYKDLAVVSVADGDSGLANKSLNLLRRAHAHCLKDLEGMSVHDLDRLTGVGKKTLDDIVRFMRVHGIEPGFGCVRDLLPDLKKGDSAVAVCDCGDIRAGDLLEVIEVYRTGDLRRLPGYYVRKAGGAASVVLSYSMLRRL